MLFPLWLTLFVVSSSRSMLVQTGVLPELLLLVVVLVLLLDAVPPPIPLELEDVVAMPVLEDELAPPMAVAELVLLDGLGDPPLELPPLPPLLLPQATAAINKVPAPPMKRIRRMVLPSVIGCSDPLMRRDLSNVRTMRGPSATRAPCRLGGDDRSASHRCAPIIASPGRSLPFRNPEARCSSALSLLSRSLDDRRALDDP
jgi:hypothetical protein